MASYQHLCTCGELIVYGPQDVGREIHCPTCGVPCRPAPVAPRPRPVAAPKAPPPAPPVVRRAPVHAERRPPVDARPPSPPIVWIVATVALGIAAIGLFVWARSAKADGRRLQRDVAAQKGTAESLRIASESATAEVERLRERTRDLRAEVGIIERDRDAAKASERSARAEKIRADEATREERSRHDTTARQLRLAQTDKTRLEKELARVEQELARAKLRPPPSRGRSSPTGTSAFLSARDLRSAGLVRILQDGGYTCEIADVAREHVRVEFDAFHMVVTPHKDATLMFTALYGWESGRKEDLLLALNELNASLMIGCFLIDDTVAYQGYLPIKDLTREGLLAFTERMELAITYCVLKTARFLR